MNLAHLCGHAISGRVFRCSPDIPPDGNICVVQTQKKAVARVGMKRCTFGMLRCIHSLEWESPPSHTDLKGTPSDCYLPCGYRAAPEEFARAQRWSFSKGQVKNSGNLKLSAAQQFYSLAA